jgi:hypothetical protein
MKKPTAITVFGVLNLVFGVLGACGVVFSLVSLFMATPGTNPVYDVMRSSVVLVYWTYASSLIGGVLTLVLCIAGIGLLMDKAWGRLASLAYGGATILFGLLGILMNAIFLFPAMLELADSSRPEVAGGVIGGVVGGVAGSCIGLVYPVLLIVFMTRKPVVEYLAGPR